MVTEKLTLVTHQRWRADDLAPYADVRIDHGLDLDAATDPSVTLWCPGAWAAAAVTRNPYLNLSSAGPKWLDELDIRLRGRDIRTTTAQALIESAEKSIPGIAFAKLPETKHDVFEAKPRVIEDLLVDLRRLPADEPVQVQTPVEFLYEVRCWVLGGEVVAHAVYMPGVPRERWPVVRRPERDTDAARWLSTVLRTELPDLPAAVVIDVGWAADPVGGRPGWRIIELNAPWSSDWYDADDTAAVIETIRASQRADPGRWRWQPSPLLARQSAALLRR